MLEEDAIEPTDINLDTDQENTGGYADSADGENISAAPVVSILKKWGIIILWEVYSPLMI